jgi:hypothetical protein
MLEAFLHLSAGVELLPLSTPFDSLASQPQELLQSATKIGEPEEESFLYFCICRCFRF